MVNAAQKIPVLWVDVFMGFCCDVLFLNKIGIYMLKLFFLF